MNQTKTPSHRPATPGHQCCGPIAVECRHCLWREEYQSAADIHELCRGCGAGERPSCYEAYDIADSETLAELRRLEDLALRGRLSGAEVGS